ncbi:MAG: hypothetical protein ACREOJ_20615, partial [Gemmatimonadaceae bacterium]
INSRESASPFPIPTIPHSRLPIPDFQSTLTPLKTSCRRFVPAPNFGTLIAHWLMLAAVLSGHLRQF